MTKFIRNNQKMLMAVFGVFLMISFVAMTGTGRQGGGTEQPVGTYDHGKATLGAKEAVNLNNQWQFLKRQFGQPVLCMVLMGLDRLDEQTLIQAMNDPRVSDEILQMLKFESQNPQLYQFFRQQDPTTAILADLAKQGSVIYQQIDTNDNMFALLVKDAQLNGVGVNPDLIESILAARQIPKESDIYPQLQSSLRSLFMINNSAARAASIVKVSSPEIANLQAERLQQLSVNVLEFSAKDFLDKVPAPTAKQLQDQFDKYKDKPSAGTGLEFGYKYPNRVSYDAIEVRRDDVKKGVPPVMPEDAADYYTAHKNESQFHSSTMPSSRPADDFNLNVGPTTRQMTFEESKPKIIQTLTDQRTKELLDKVRDSIRDTMKADYDAYKVAMDAKATTAPVSSLGVPYNTQEYISKLKAKILAEFKVELVTERDDALSTMTELQDAKRKKEGFSTPELQIPFAVYMTTALEPFLKDVSESVRKALNAARGERHPIDVWEPTPAFETADRDAYLIARATKADPAHVPASLDEVKAKVTEDYKLAAANELAKKAAQDALAAAKTPKWLYTVAADEGRKAFTTELFGVTNARMQPGVPGYPDLKGDAINTFKLGAIKLLSAPPRTGKALKPATTTATTQATTMPTTRTVAKATTAPTTAPSMAEFKDHPVTVIELPSEAKVVVAELEQLKPQWSKEQQAQLDSQLANQRRIMGEREIRLEWFNYDQLLQRIDWKPADGRQPKPNNNNAPPIVPFGT